MEMNSAALFKVEYGLYVLLAREGDKDNGCIINTVLQITSSPPFVGVVSVNKQNKTHDMIVKTGEFNVSVLTQEAPYEMFQRFGFQSGGTVDKFAGFKGFARSENGIAYLTDDSNAYLSFKVTGTIDFGTHTLFKADIVGGEVLSNAESVTYEYYQSHIKPKPQAKKTEGSYVCKVCGWVYDPAKGDPTQNIAPGTAFEDLPQAWVCPICKHGKGDFNKL